MSATVISVENVSKYYRLGLIGGGTLRADFERWWAKARDKPDPLFKIGQEEQSNRRGEYIWALRDVSFEVKEGEVLGIIGRNGAGKSTLLKILSSVTAPTSGQIKIKGRIASLLEVGTGFHPELTGRENIYLNGAILGMKKAETDRKFDEIAAFAEIEQFIDTPVKRYSSGMYVRLAFAVAAHLEPEMLVVDEVLAVGDAEFQRKCLGKMSLIASGGRTVLFVSHNMGSIRRLCDKTALLYEGRLQFLGETDIAVETYQAMRSPLGATIKGRFERDITTDVPARSNWVQAVELHDMHGNLCIKFKYGEDMKIVFELRGEPVREGISISWILSDSQGANIAWSNSVLTSGYRLPRGANRAVCIIKELPLSTGTYTFAFSSGIVNSREPKDVWRDAAKFEIIECDPFMTMYEHHSVPLGAVILDHEWKTGP